ncbi:GNAT family N-acetyltransferase [Anaerolineales bacterium HSG24]|nr:GNAT family N-acetyltransferase [Anaerolineales bacterium HSG24]
MSFLIQPSTKSQSYGLRPLNPLTDLGQVANLIEDAFSTDLDYSGQSALNELRWLNRFKPLLWWMLLVNFDQNDFLSGFVWEEDGRIVGNVTVNQMGISPRRWLISNVAVSEAYRGCGIATGLLGASAELVKNQNGSYILLQVRANNAPAIYLYNSLQFQQIGGTAYLKINYIPRPPAGPPPLPNGIVLRIRRYDWYDNRQVFQLAKLSIPASVQKEWPLRQRYFFLDGYDQFKDFFRRLAGYGPAHWVAEKEQQIIATVNICPNLFRQPHTIDLMVHPEHRNNLEEPLITRALNYLSRWNNQYVTVKHPVDHPEAIAIYKSIGFYEDQTLLWMKREI